jgi:hypothetical protein
MQEQQQSSRMQTHDVGTGADPCAALYHMPHEGGSGTVKGH